MSEAIELNVPEGGSVRTAAFGDTVQVDIVSDNGTLISRQVVPAGVELRSDGKRIPTPGTEQTRGER